MTSDHHYADYQTTLVWVGGGGGGGGAEEVTFDTNCFSDVFRGCMRNP